MERRSFLALGAAPLLKSAAARPSGAIGMDVPMARLAAKETIEKLKADFPGLRFVSMMGGRMKLPPELLRDVPKAAPGERRRATPVENFAEVDDSATRRAIDLLHEAGLEVFASALGWKSMGMANPSWRVVGLDGQLLPDKLEPKYVLETTPAACPNRPEVRRWKRAVVTGLIANYDVDSLLLRFSNFNQPGFYPGLFCCWCEHCRATAEELKYDFPRMRASLEKALAGLKKLDRRALARLAQSDGGFVGFFCRLADSEGPAEWFNFRADYLTQRIAELCAAAEPAARKKGARFGAMTYYPTFALLVGHRTADLAGAVSFTVPQYHHWQSLYLLNLMAFAAWFQESIPQLPEGEALQAAYRLFGVDGYALPESYREMPVEPAGGDGPRSNHPALIPIIAAELRKGRRWGGGVVAYPMLKQTVWKKPILDQLQNLAFEVGYEGVWYQ